MHPLSEPLRSPAMVSLLRLHFGTDCMLTNPGTTVRSMVPARTNHTSGNCDILKLKGIIETKIHDAVSELVSFMPTCTLLIDIDIPVSVKRRLSKLRLEMHRSLEQLRRPPSSRGLSKKTPPPPPRWVSQLRFHFWYFLHANESLQPLESTRLRTVVRPSGLSIALSLGTPPLPSTASWLA
jgi:hypothetical protein